MSVVTTYHSDLKIMLNLDWDITQVIECLPGMQDAVGGVPASQHITRPGVQACNPTTGKVQEGIQSLSLLHSEFKVSLHCIRHARAPPTHTHTYPRCIQPPSQHQQQAATTEPPQPSPCKALPPPSCSECSDLGKGQNSPLNSGTHN